MDLDHEMVEAEEDQTPRGLRRCGIQPFRMDTTDLMEGSSWTRKNIVWSKKFCDFGETVKASDTSLNF